MESLRGRVTTVNWRDEFTGETFANIAPDGPNPRRLSYPFLGTFAHGVYEGELLTIQGRWEQHARLGEIFKVSKIERRPPTTREGEVIFLVGYIKGMTKKQAALLLEKYHGLEGLKAACKERPQELDDLLPKAKKVRGRLRQAAWDRRELDVDIMVALQSAGLRANQIQELTRFFGAAGLRQVAQTSPYDFCQVPKVGFSSAEKVAKFYAEAQGRPLDRFNEERLVFGLLDVVGKERQSGNICAPEDRIVRRGVKILELPNATRAEREASEAKLREALGTALKRRLLIKDFDKIYPRGLHKAEGDLALHLGKLMVGGARPLFQNAKAIVKELAGTRLSDEQKEAVATIGTAPVSLLLGGPGRGKTFTLSSFIALLDKYRRTYLILAPTGKAAKRAAEVTGKECQTIHKACGLEREEDANDRKYGGKLGRRDRFNVDVIIVDESSMIDLDLGFQLVRRCKPGRTAVVFVGDQDQLPPVGPGQVLKDLINSAVIPTAKLTQVFRQANGSPIVDGADALNAGQAPPFKSTGYEVRLFDPTAAKGHPGHADQDAAWAFEVQKTADWLPQVIDRYATDLKLDPTRDFQIYAPQKDGLLGLRALNQMLQARLNPAAPGANQGAIKIDGGFAVRMGDKVMQMKNNYRMRTVKASAAARAAGRTGATQATDAVKAEHVSVMNGQVGYVTRVDALKGELEVKYDDFAEPVLYLRREEWGQLGPAYAMSIHRSQGSETPYAIIVLHPSMNARLVNRPLIYTGWTRAKKGVVLICPEPCVLVAAQNTEGTNRDGNLHLRLRSVVAGGATRKKIVLTVPGGASATNPAAGNAAGTPTGSATARPATALAAATAPTTTPAAGATPLPMFQGVGSDAPVAAAASAPATGPAAGSRPARPVLRV